MHPFIADEVIAMSKRALKLLYSVIICPLLKDDTKNQHTYVVGLHNSGIKITTAILVWTTAASCTLQRSIQKKLIHSGWKYECIFKPLLQKCIIRNSILDSCVDWIPTIYK